MGICCLTKTVAFLYLMSLASLSLASTRKLTALYEAPPLTLVYHKGPLLQGDLPVSILWYGKFSPAQKSVITDFLISLNTAATSPKSGKQPSVAQWWNLVQIYLKKAGKKPAMIGISSQVTDEKYSMGKVLSRAQIQKLAGNLGTKPGGVSLVLTSQDVAVERFCMSTCGFHEGDKKKGSSLLWVGNSATQCPGQCAWPFHQPLYGPQTAPLVAPSGDVGMDGMVINIASLLAGTVTNPFGNGYFKGDVGAGLEVGSACVGVFGKSAYPGYAGEVLMDNVSGASYNVVGANGRKYMLPALFNPSTSQCATSL